MKILCFHIKSDCAEEEAWNELESKGLELLYSCEDLEEGILIFAHDHPSFGTVTYRTVSKITSQNLPETDWEAQWETNTEGFKEGVLTVELNKFDPSINETILMQSGPGFGDLSHATTRLVMQLMSKIVKNQFVVDVGCGSGVLSFTAIAMGADFALGIDIDPNAILHAKKNASLNHFEDQAQFVMPDEVQIPSTVKQFVALMNMIRTEQKEAWEQLPQLHKGATQIITSGVLVDDREKYLALTKSWGWTCIEEGREGEWMAFLFQAFLS